MRKIILFCLAVIMSLTAICFTACGQNSSAVKIALDKEDEGRYDELFEYFTQTTGIAISATYGQDVSKLVGTKDEPDIIKTSTVNVRSMKDSFISLNSMISSNGVKTTEYIDSIMNALTIDGQVYALPTSINTSLLYYNKDMFDAKASEIRSALNLEEGQSIYPNESWDYDDFKKAGVVLTVGQNGVYTQFGCETQIKWWGEWLVYVNQCGGSFYQAGSNNKVSGLDSQEVLTATEFFVKKSMGNETEKFSPNAIEIEGGFSFLSGKCAMVLGGHTGDWFSYDKLGLNWDISVLPTPVGNPNAVGGEISADAFGISARSRKAEEAFKFLQLWAGKEGAVKMYANNKLSALKNLQEIIEELPEEQRGHLNMNAFFTAVEKAVTLPNEQDFSKVCRERVMSELYRLFLPSGPGRETDVSAALARAKASVDGYYANLI